MLFSNAAVATVINLRFEPVWVSLRPVPLITIDFGNGNVVKRTLHGNVATYACTSDGEVLDILPGIYEPNTYLNRLRQLSTLYKMVGDGLTKERDLGMLATYHQRQFEALSSGQPPFELSKMPMVSITGVELNTRILMQPAKRMQARAAFSRDTGMGMGEKIEKPTKLDPDDLSNWEALAKDTEQNETVRRMAIHNYLKDRVGANPDDVAKWIYREVLHADLDDPYLGLGKLLFDSYPFAKEDGFSTKRNSEDR